MPLIVTFQRVQRSMQKGNDESQNEAGGEQRHSSRAEASTRTGDIGMEENQVNRPDNRNRERIPRDDLNASDSHSKKRKRSEDAQLAEEGDYLNAREPNSKKRKGSEDVPPAEVEYVLYEHGPTAKKRKRSEDVPPAEEGVDLNVREPNSKKGKRSEDVPTAEVGDVSNAHDLNDENDSNTEDEDRRLIEIYNKKKDIIIADVEPLLIFEDDENLQRRFGELHDELQSCRSSRKDRILILIRHVDSIQDGAKIKILAAMSKKYESIFIDNEAFGASGYTPPQNPVSTQMETDRFPTQSTTPHENFVERLDIQMAERQIENAVRFNDLGTDEIKEIAKQFRSARISSLILKFCGFSRNEIQKLKNFCYSEMASIWVFSVLDEFSVNVLNNKGVREASFEVYIDDEEMKFEEIDCGCFCVIDRLCIQKYTEAFKQILNEIQTKYIDMLLESKMLSVDLTSALEHIKNSDDYTDKQQQILDFLLRDELPGVCFCMLENTIKAEGGNLDIIHNIMQETTTEKDNNRRECLELMGLSNKGEENLKGQRYADEHTQNQCQALKCALISSYGDMVDELEPLLLLKYLEKEDAKKLAADKGKRRHERVTTFLQQIFKDETYGLVFFLIKTMKQHYQNIVKTVMDVLQNGSKCEHYRCPRLKGPVLVCSTNITLLDPGKDRIELKTTKGSELLTHKVSDTIIETEKMRVCLVKVYGLMKKEMEKKTVKSLACHLKHHGLISDSDLQTITEYSGRREGVDRLLKKVLGGSDFMQKEFSLALKRDMPYLAQALETESASGMEMKKFKLLEEGRQCHQKPRFLLTKRQCDILLKALDNENKLSQLNDQLLSTLTFSIGEHTEVEALPFESRAQKLIDTLMTCSPMAFLQLCGILLKIGLQRVAEMLMTSDDGHTKDPEPSQMANGDYQFLEPSLEDMVVSIITRSTTVVSRQTSRLTKTRITMRVVPSDTNLQEYTKDIGFKLEDANRESSIVLSLSPKAENSWHNLEMKCRSGKIKDFIPAVFNDISTEYLKEGQYRLKLTIYALPSSKEPWMKNAYICLQNESEKKSEELREFVRVLHEELDVTEGLLKKLKDGRIIDKTIHKKILVTERRSQKVELLLKVIRSSGRKGFEVLKESIKETNTYLYNYIVKNEQGHSFTDLFGSTAHESEKEIFFTCTVILSVKKKETSGDPGSSKPELEISCPQMIDPVYMFKDKGKIPKSDRKAQSTESSLKESKAEKTEGKVQRDNPKASTSNKRPEEEGKSSEDKPEKDASKETTFGIGVSVESDKESTKSIHSKGERKAK